MKKTWLNEHVGAVIALSFIAFTFFIFRMVLLKQVLASDTVTSTIIASVTNIVMLIIGYYFGSSQGSKNKQEIMDKMNDTPGGIKEEPTSPAQP